MQLSKSLRIAGSTVALIALVGAFASLGPSLTAPQSILGPSVQDVSTRGSGAGALDLTEPAPPQRTALITPPKPVELVRRPLPRWSDFRDPSHFIDDPTCNPQRLRLDAQHEAELKALLADIDSKIGSLRSQMHSVAALHMQEAVGMGLARADTGPAEVDRMGDKELRVFLQINNEQHFVDLDRQQFP
ncbi:MAG: hypothetical protein LH624_19275 [Cryobacterium sp.]|nr:hypothetical protein [Cryobacterium sp.]